MGDLFENMPGLSAWLTEHGLNWLENLLSIVLAFALAWLAVRLVTRFTRRSAERYKARRSDVATLRRVDTAVSMINSAAKALVIFVAAGIALGELGLAKVMNAMLVAAGIGSVAVGIGAQSLIGDLIAGVCMLMDEQMVVGDYVKLNGVAGTVERVTLRTVSLRLYQGEICTIQNSKIDSVINYSQGGFLTLVDMGIARDGDVERAFEIMLCVMEEIRNDMGADDIEPPARVGIISTGAEEGITLRVSMRADITRQWSMQYEARRRIRAKFEEAGVEPANVRVEARA